MQMIRGSLLIAPSAERFVLRRFAPARFFSTPEAATSPSGGRDSPEQAEKKRLEEIARQKKRAEAFLNWVGVVDEAARIKITRTPELQEEHSKIAVEYSKQMQRRSNYQNYDLTTKSYLKKEAIAALPPALRVHAEQKIKWTNRKAINTASAMFDKLPVWHTPPIDDPSIIFDLLLNDEKVEYNRTVNQLPALKITKKVKELTPAQKRKLKKERAKASREAAARKKAKAKEASKKK